MAARSVDGPWDGGGTGTGTSALPGSRKSRQECLQRMELQEL